MKWVFVRKHFPNQWCCMHSTLSNTYTHTTAQYTHPLNSPHPLLSLLLACFFVCFLSHWLQLIFLLSLKPFPLHAYHTRLTPRDGLWINKTFQQMLARLKKEKKRGSKKPNSEIVLHLCLKVADRFSECCYLCVVASVHL